MALGTGALRLNTSGSRNVAIGIFAGRNLSSGSYNTFSGVQTGSSITTGSNNTVLGASPSVGFITPGITTGSNNTIIGANIIGLAPDLSNHIILGDGSGNQRLVIDQNGYTGIGTTTPNEKLEVAGAVVLGGGTANLDGTNLGFVSNQSARLVIGTNRTGYEGEFDFIANKGSGNNGGFAFYQHDDDGTERELIKFKGNGYVGIGMTNPDEKLAVNGTVHAKEVRVDLTGWPDYVFKSQFKLTPLSEVKTYIDQHQHLPGIPSAEQVAKEGVNIGEMNAKLLKKIEELTLYLIEKDKKDQELQSQVNELKKQLLALSKTR